MIALPSKTITSLQRAEFNEFSKGINLEKVFYIEIDGSKINKVTDLYKAFGDIIGFPDWFGNNWDAFWDLLRDDYFMSKDLMVVITKYDELFSGVSDGYENEKIFTRILIDLIQIKHIKTKIHIIFLI